MYCIISRVIWKLYRSFTTCLPNMKLAIFTFLVAFVSAPVSGSNILVLCPQSPSHCNEMFAIGNALHERGHKIFTVLQSSLVQQYSDTILPKSIKVFAKPYPDNLLSPGSETIQQKVMELSMKKEYKEIQQHNQMLIPHVCLWMLKDLNLKEFVQDNNITFAVVDCHYSQPCLAVVAHALNLPFVCRTTNVEAMTVRVPFLPSFVPALGTSNSQTMMSLWERICNLAAGLKNVIVEHPSRKGPWNRELVRTYAANIGSLQEVVRKAKLHIQTRDHILEYPQPTMPNVITVYGVTAKPAGKVNKLLESLMVAEHGTIIVSFSTATASLPQAIIYKFFEAFSKLPQSVIMVYSSNLTLTQIPKNVYLFPWLPINDLLGHPNTRAFLTHAGNNGRSEAVYHGIPMVAMPLFSEQPHNAQKIVEKKLGVILNFDRFTSIELHRALVYVMTNPRIKQSINHTASIIKSQMSGAEHAAFWIDHAIRFGTEHLVSYGYTMPWYQFLMLDIIAVFLLIWTSGTVLVVWRVSKMLYASKQKPKMN